jgi:hypothetical protein
MTSLTRPTNCDHYGGYRSPSIGSGYVELTNPRALVSSFGISGLGSLDVSEFCLNGKNEAPA